MQIAIPKSDIHPQVRLTVKTSAGDIQVTADDSHKFFEIDLPAGVVEGDVEVIAEFCNRAGQPDPGACQIILKEREPADVHDGSQTEPHEDDVPVRLEDSTAESGSEPVVAHAEDHDEENTSGPEPSGPTSESDPEPQEAVSDAKEAATNREPS